MSIAKWAVTRPVAVSMRILALVLLGAICFISLRVDLLPKVELPVIAVNTTWPNTAPQEMETQITRPIEQAVSTVPGLYSVSSTSELGQSSVRVTLNYGVNVDQATVSVLQYVQRATRNFPSDPNLLPPTVFKFDPNSFPILFYGVSGIDDPVKLRTLLENDIVPKLESADGVAQVSISGGQERAIIVDVDPQRLEAYGLSLADVISRLRAENISLPAGLAQQGAREYTIRSNGYFKRIEDAQRMPVGMYDGRQIRLSDVANVRDEAQEQRVFTRLNGNSAIALTVIKQTDANTVQTADNVREKLKEIAETYPELKFGMVYDQSAFVEDSIHLLQEHVIIGGVLAILAILFFLRNVRSTLVVGLSIPISIMSTFALMYFCGFTLNTISLSALALATGLIVDDAIVVLENIFRHIERDRRSRTDAAVQGTTEIMGAVVASTITVMVVFVPLFLIRGQSGQIFTQMALVVIFSLGVSLMDAVTVVPTLASRFIREEEIQELEDPDLRAARGKRATPLTRTFEWMGRRFHTLDTSYRHGLQWALRHRAWILVGAGVITLAALPLWPMVGQENLPKSDTGDLSARVRLPIGTSLATTQAKMAQVERILLKDPDVETVFTTDGANIGFRGGGANPTPYQGSANIHLKADRKSTTEEVIKRMQRAMGQIPGIRANVTPFDLVANIIGGNSQGLEVDIFGNDLTELSKTAKDVQQALNGIPGLDGVDVTVDEATPELQWNFNREKAQALGVTFADVANAIGTSTNGTLATYYQEGGFQYPIYVQMPILNRREVPDLLRLPIKQNGDGGQVLLGQVATPIETVGPNQINRLNRQRFIGVTGRVTDRAESDVQADMVKAMKAYELPRGMTWELGQNQQRRAQEFAGMGLAVFLAIALIYMLLASQFESLTYPFVVLFTVPLCVVGVILALFLTDRAFGLTAFVGLLMLVGIVVKNGILLVDYTNHLRAQGLSRDEAILRAAPTRLRPILMTSISAILGMIPLAAAMGAASALQAPLATVVIGGLSTSTVLTLFVVPVVYTYVDDFTRRISKQPRDLATPTLVEPSLASTGPIAND